MLGEDYTYIITANTLMVNAAYAAFDKELFFDKACRDFKKLL